MMLSVILFFVGFYILIKGANFLVDGATSISSKLRIPSFLIGLLIVGIGTSIPEFATFFISHMTTSGEVGVGAVVGSNTFNILFILGVSALFFPIRMKKEWVERDLLWNIAAVFVVIFFSFLLGKGGISQIEGLFLIAIFLYWVFASIKDPNERRETHHIEVRQKTLFVAFGLVFAGLIGTILGGKWVVDGAIVMAQSFGVSERFIGLTLVGIGTSLPEFVASFVAAYRKEPGIAIGNVIGSNIFDFLMILGFGALAKPVLFNMSFLFDIVVTLLAAIVLYGSVCTEKTHTLKRWHGLLFILFYLSYLIYLFR